MTSMQYWKFKFGEPPKTDADKLACAMMAEYHRHERNSYALKIAQKAVEEEKSKYQIGKYTTGSHLDSLAQSARMALDSLLNRIEKIKEES